MRLIDTSTLELKEFREPPPRYAILSHVWATPAEEEITFEDIRSPQSSSDKPGWRKLKGFCALARSLGFEYGWDDTCCIDKNSQTDVTKSIQSMYAYYSEAGKCIVYLEDVGPGKKSFEESDWFSRGWTLQELVAPNDLEFYDYQWISRGHKKAQINEISKVTEIPHAVLTGTIRPQQCSVAQRMSWAAGRKTTEPEDRVYSLKGLFDVVLSVSYGESLESAFFRLQTEIIRDSSDESIFAWHTPAPVTSSSGDHQRHFGLLAPSPDCFASCRDFVSAEDSNRFSYGNGVLSIPLQVRPYALESYLALLNVVKRGQRAQIGILLGRLATGGTLVRLEDDQDEPRMENLTKAFRRRRMEVTQKSKENPLSLFQGFWLRQLEPPGHQNCRPQILSKAPCLFQDRIALAANQYGTAGVVCMVPRHNPNSTRPNTTSWLNVRWLKFGFDNEFNPVCMIANASAMQHQYIKLNQQLLDEALDTAANSDQRSSLKIFRDHWLPADDEVIKRETTWRNGYVIMKGTRDSGLNIVIDAIGLEVSITKLLDRHPSPVGDPVATNPRLVWTVDVKSMAIVGRPATQSAFSCWAWCFIGICECLSCANMNEDTSMVNTMTEVDAKGPPITYREGHQAWR